MSSGAYKNAPGYTTPRQLGFSKFSAATSPFVGFGRRRDPGLDKQGEVVTERKKKSAWSLLNPLEWLSAALQLVAAIFAPLLRWLGMLAPPSTEGFANIQKSDVDEAKQLAEQQEAAVDALSREMSPSEVVRAYAKADVAGRAVMDLAALSMEQQDWLLRLSDEDLDKLGMLTKSGCARSLEAREVLPIYPKAAAEAEAPEVLDTPSAEEIEQMKRDFVSARFRELFHAPGVPNTDPRFVPATVH